MNMSQTNKHRFDAGFAVAGALMTIVFFAIVNIITSRGYLWFIYPSFAVLWWPVSVIFARGRPRIFSVVCSVMTLLFLALINLMFSPFYLWVLYAAFPLLCWPVIVCLGKRAGRLPAAMSISLLVIAYYILLNIFYSPGFPWFIFPTYAVLWWPLAVAFAKKRRPMLFSLSAVLWSSLFFIVLNTVTTPHEIWAVYPIFALLWWPLSVFCFVYKKRPAV
ncbi:hypothetical protein SAMN02745823_01006 [Sporobacter termitidis DSM 10068]|uniref:Uncharacterized protein n=1 Tax=Sporobacter termitidis DSM 10068 TaxID=1123282 RepID=A0A1M5VSS6_9FIRM|nr:hypothetical protein [Sporobacter termitidis]SHH78301.1 hypothetical protein SAMN02745823_01006 [Sporobacter termitidis DSM 10068]